MAFPSNLNFPKEKVSVTVAAAAAAAKCVLVRRKK